MVKVNKKKMKILDNIDSKFVDNYSEMVKYKDNVDDILSMMGFNKFESYNSFCSSIRNKAEEYIKNNDDNIDNVLSIAINMAIRSKIISDDDYINKITMYFNDKKMVNIVEKDKKK